MELTIPSAKNSTLPLMMVPILVPGRYTLMGVYPFTDLIEQMSLLRQLNIEIECIDNKVTIDSRDLQIHDNFRFTYNKSTRGSFYLSGALLHRKTRVTYEIPGGCDIGNRKIDFHLDFFTRMGCKYEFEDNGILIDSSDFKDQYDLEYHFPRISVGATLNAILASVIGSGIVTLHNVATDPYISDLINLLKSSGIDIELDTDKRKIVICRKAHFINQDKINHEIIPDPIIAGTYITMDLIQNRGYTIGPIVKDHLGRFWDILIDIGVEITEYGDNRYSFKLANKKIDFLKVSTDVFPEFYTDLQPILVILCKHKGIDLELKETVMDSRFKYTKELYKLGYNICTDGDTLRLSSNDTTDIDDVSTITLTDLRGGIAIYAELLIQGKTDIRINKYEYILRGYDIDTFNKYFGI
jgi:UDP-N-acetylglucosamine 1-carboxyvinyltransferase